MERKRTWSWLVRETRRRRIRGSDGDNWLAAVTPKGTSETRRRRTFPSQVVLLRLSTKVILVLPSCFGFLQLPSCDHISTDTQSPSHKLQWASITSTGDHQLDVLCLFYSTNMLITPEGWWAGLGGWVGWGSGVGVGGGVPHSVGPILHFIGVPSIM